MLGTGVFGQVIKVEEDSTKKIYAAKIIKS
jgi:hypothetical protein